MKRRLLELWNSKRFWNQFSLVCLVVWCATGCVGCGLATWLMDANSILPVVLNSVLGVLQLIAVLRGGSLSQSEADAVTKIATDTQNALEAIQKTVDEYEQAPSTTLLGDIQAGVKAVTDNLNAFLAAVSITDPATKAKITDILTLVLDQITAWATIIPALSGTAKPTVAPNTVNVAHDQFQISIPLTKKQYKETYNEILTQPSGSAEVDAALAKLKKM